MSRIPRRYSHFLFGFIQSGLTKRTSLVALQMSAIGGKADIPIHGCHARTTRLCKQRCKKILNLAPHGAGARMILS